MYKITNIFLTENVRIGTGKRSQRDAADTPGPGQYEMRKDLGGIQSRFAKTNNFLFFFLHLNDGC
jgi:hypothetical protein